LKILYGVMIENQYGLTPRVMRGKKVLVNNTGKRVVHSPAEKINGVMTDEIAVDPGQVMMYVNQASVLPLSEVLSYVVVGYEIEIDRWISHFYYEPHLAPGLVDINIDGLAIMGVPISLEVLKSYPVKTRAELHQALQQRNLNSAQRKVVDTLMIISLI
jgi:hypothetical protein